MDYGEGIAAPIGGDTTTNDERRGGERRGGLDLIDGHTSICRLLDINCGDVSPQDFRRAALSDDPRVQLSRL